MEFRACKDAHFFPPQEVEPDPFLKRILRAAVMSNPLSNIYNSTGMNRLVEFIRTFSEGNPDLPLEHLLLISRVLFAIVLIGFIGYFFDRTKDAVKSSINNKR